MKTLRFIALCAGLCLALASPPGRAVIARHGRAGAREVPPPVRAIRPLRFAPRIFVESPRRRPAQPKPFGLPFADPPGPNTWLLGQPYGNTVFAYRTRTIQYGAGQGLHFGLDLSARCGTPVIAIGDGLVTKIDASSHGAGPHNLMVLHENDLASFYGHLLERPNLKVGQPVTRGQVLALTGDPDLTCTSRPHLHLEIRNSAYTYAYNPILFIDADWESLALAGPFGVSFARDLDNPRQWQALDDQPEVHFGYELLNDYPRPWPPEWNGR